MVKYSLILRDCQNEVQNEFTNKTEVKYLCWILFGFRSIGTASPGQREVPCSIPDPQYISLCQYLVNQSSTEFSEFDPVEEM